MGPPMANCVQEPAETGGAYKRFVRPYEEVERANSRYLGHRRTVGSVMERRPGVTRVGDPVLALSLRSFLAERALDLLKHPSLGRIPGTAAIWQGDQLRHRFTSLFGSDICSLPTTATIYRPAVSSRCCGSKNLFRRYRDRRSIVARNQGFTA